MKRIDGRSVNAEIKMEIDIVGFSGIEIFVITVDYGTAAYFSNFPTFSFFYY
jgi:hypothetical protein